MTSTKSNIAQDTTNRHNSGRIHYLDRRDLERRLELQQRISAHLARLSVHLAARLAEVRHGR